MDNNQKNLFLSVGAFLMLISRAFLEDIKVENGHYLSYEGNVTDKTLVNYLIATMLMDWNTIIYKLQEINAYNTYLGFPYSVFRFL